jgi:hypothetical protein
MIHKNIKSATRKTGAVSEYGFSLPLFFLCLFVSAFFFLFPAGCQPAPKKYPYIDHASMNPEYHMPPAAPVWIPPKVEIASDVPRSWYPPSSIEKNWTAIIVHHSATETGNMAIFDKEHKSLGWDGVGYDFVIGNGTDSGDGQVEVTFRWRQQVTGAHCKTPDNWANEDGIGICLVGNFDDLPPTQKQMQALVKLTDFLQKRYRIPQSRIYGHGTTPGAHITDCPGTLFPMSRFKSMLNF